MKKLRRLVHALTYLNAIRLDGNEASEQLVSFEKKNIKAMPWRGNSLPTFALQMKPLWIAENLGSKLVVVRKKFEGLQLAVMRQRQIVVERERRR